MPQRLNACGRIRSALTAKLLLPVAPKPTRNALPTRGRSGAGRRPGEAAAAAAAEAAKKKDNPARTWVQIATGAANVMGSEYRRQSAGKNATIFKGQSGYTAPFGRSQRLLVGPFDTMRDANSWLASLKKNGGDGFVWTSDTGEEVTPVGRR